MSLSVSWTSRKSLGNSRKFGQFFFFTFIDELVASERSITEKVDFILKANDAFK